ncbi:MAG: CBS domain-containing protein [Candidatus Gastranaerophilales bacterium]|nr:CBS domain-containing protein [Candidatus Gastranaerophilales bacterium]
MNNQEIKVKDHLKLSPVYVFENDTLFKALDIIKKFKIDGVTIIREDYSIVGYVEKRKIIEILKLNFHNDNNVLISKKIKDAIIKYDSPMFLYPRMTLIDAYSIMKCFNLTGLPVADVPWEKKIIGFLWLKDILPFIEKNYLKIPV